MRAKRRKNAESAIECALLRSGSQVMRQLIKNFEIGKIWPWMTSGDFHLNYKMTEVVRQILDALSNAAYRVSLRGPGAELHRRGINHPRPGAGGAQRRPGAG